MNFWDEKEAKRLFEELPFYNASIEKPDIKHLNNIDLLCARLFRNKLNMVKTSKISRGYARRYNIEVLDSKDPSVQLTIINQVLRICLRIY